ncbi:hypothetical protein MGYG_02803 [Nannizzia gypsea CBS 118893]|uniref:Zn(2)-C6 fungal-type domain-containing protein n=1 Tax=Arthroderma gypseum (strain ATCC MYA-4604 / CBS 118893) TaxID=535722 RepID=E4UP65_ARTGP|nr:hypothetical protein MGYG_02803 [Nannizzia gypsea CBS 118893]EFQ99791.1 hypothetical protein MGYG_02803 [Nannizzia gypsea CBS 118893]
MSSDGTETSTNYPLPQFSVSHSRRTTCDMCRERKVRCDRGKPECGRCKKTLKEGQKCTYPSAGGEAAKFSSALRNLHARLAHAESKLQERGISFSKESEIGPRLEFSNLPHELSNDVDVGDIPLDFGSWEGAAIDFDSIDGIFDDTVRESLGLQGDFSAALNPSLPELKAGPPSTTSVTASRCPNPGILLNVGHISEETMQSLFEAYYHVVQKHLQLVDQMKTLQSTLSTDTHQGQALRYAVGMAGAGTFENPADLQQQCYVAARFHLEMAETQTDSSSLFSLETVQALILVARFEFTHGREAAALITAARLSRLIGLLGYDRLGVSDTRTDKGGILSPVRLEEMKRTFWTGFLLKCHATTRCPGTAPIVVDEIHTVLPSKLTTTESDHGIFIREAGTQSAIENLQPFSLLVLAMNLLASTHQHQRMTEANVARTGAQDYNFCLTHERIDTKINIILNCISSFILLKGPDTEICVLTLVIVLGVRIALYNAAIVNVQKASFLGPIVGESEKIGISAANAMCDVLLEADVLGARQAPIYKEMSLFIMPPLSLAASIQLRVLESWKRGTGLNTYNTNREIRLSLKTIFNAMNTFKGSTTHYEPQITKCREFLDSIQFGERFNSELGVPVYGNRGG